MNVDIGQLIARYAPMLKRMGRGPERQPWPCPHDQVTVDQRDGAKVCRRCNHVVKP
jgi:hypothetical protein